VKNINAHDQRREIYPGIYNEMIIPALQYIEQKNYNKALIVYRDYTLKLKTKYGS